MRCLGLDLGSSSIKGAVLDLESLAVSHVQSEPFPSPVKGLPPSWFEIDPVAVVDSSRRVLQRLAEFAPDCAGVFVCSQMGGLILATREGKPLTRYLSWRDQRSLVAGASGPTPFDAFRARLGEQALSELGGECKAGSATVLLSCLDTLPKGGVPLSLGDFVLSHLTGSAAQVHPTAAIGLLNVRNQTWHKEVFARLGWDHLHWPQLADTRVPVGEWEFQGRKIPVYPSFGDQQCALYGAGVQPGDLSINASTGAQVSRLRSGFQPGNYQTRAYFDGWNLDTITHIPAGRALNALVDLLCECSRGTGQPEFDPWPYIRQTQAEGAHIPAGPAGMEVDLSFFPGPLGDSGAITGITLENLSIGSLFHAALISMAKGFGQCAGRLDGPEAWKSIVLSGGLTHNFPKLKTLLQGVFPKLPQRENPPTEETLCGLMRIAQSVRTASAKDHQPVAQRN